MKVLKFMPIKIVETEIKGVLILEHELFEDDRGFFREVFHSDKYQFLNERFLQDNHSHSKKGVLRGLHYQLNFPQAKLVTAITGEIFDVAVDIRKGSETFGKWIGVYLTPENRKQIYIPEGLAHGFCVLSDNADVLYKCTNLYRPEDEYGLLWSDTTVNIKWPVNEPTVSDKDSVSPELKDISDELLPAL